MRRFLFLALVFLLAAPVCRAQESAVKYKEAPIQIVVSFTGDCTLGCTPDQRLNSRTSFEGYIQREGMEYPFAKVRDIFENDDLTVVNLESVFYDSEAYRADKSFNFRSPTSYVHILPLGGVDAVSVGNNHVLDYGEAGFRSTVKALEDAGIPWFGATQAGANTYIFEKDGVKIGFAAVYISAYWQDRDQTVRCFQTLKDAGCSLIVGCIHGGVEYDVTHDEYVQGLADSFIRLGADVVIGHHPHTLQGMRVENGRTTLWSLGNFVFGGNPEIRVNHAGESVISTMIAQITFSFDENGAYLGHQVNIIPCHMSGHADYNDYQPCPVTGADADRVVRALQRDTQPYGLKVQPYVEGVGALQPFVPAPASR